MVVLLLRWSLGDGKEKARSTGSGGSGSGNWQALGGKKKSVAGAVSFEF